MIRGQKPICRHPLDFTGTITLMIPNKTLNHMIIIIDYSRHFPCTLVILCIK